MVLVVCGLLFWCFDLFALRVVCLCFSSACFVLLFVLLIG